MSDKECGCILRDNKLLISSCDFHNTVQKAVRVTTCAQLMLRVQSAFSDNHLYELKDRICKDIRELSK